MSDSLATLSGCTVVLQSLQTDPSVRFSFVPPEEAAHTIQPDAVLTMRRSRARCGCSSRFG